MKAKILGTYSKHVASDGKNTAIRGDRMTVAVIIPVFNQSQFLAETIASVLAQTRPADEIIVVDDVSTDNPASIVSKFKNVQLLVHSKNQHVAAARNTGLKHCSTSHVVFLDGDDRLLPDALKAGLACFAARPEYAFVYGGHREISEGGSVISSDIYRPIKGDPYTSLLCRNPAGPPATAMFRRDCALAVGGYDDTLRLWEDYDIYLRLAQRYPAASHPTIVAEYRQRDQYPINRHLESLRWGLETLRRQSPIEPAARANLKSHRALLKNYFISNFLSGAIIRWRSDRQIGVLVNDLIKVTRASPLATMRILMQRIGSWTGKALRHPVFL
jgi:glycosyltransferase involved in cell wall biosynthesis